MKKILYTLLILTAYLLISCEEKEVIFNESAALVSFNDPEQNYAVIPTDDPGFEVSVGVSNLSDTDRRFTVSVDTDRSSATSDMYTIDESSLVIPAGEYIGKLRVNSDFNELPASGSVRLVIKLESVDNGELHGRTLETSVFLFRFCPFDDGVTFTGSYALEVTSTSTVFGAMVEGVVSIREGSTAAERIITNSLYPGFNGSGFTGDVTFNLICDNVVLALQNPAGIGCGNAPIVIGPPSVGVSVAYDPSDDSELIINYNDNPLGANCAGFGAFINVPTTIKLTKQ